MIEIQPHYSLKNYNTFGIAATAASYTAVTTIQQLREALSYFKDESVFLLGGGSNMLLINDVARPVIHVKLKGIEVVDKSHNDVYLKVMAGENWHNLVMHCVDNNLAGIENMALIPGNTGTAPIQNIGAYGMELKDVFHSCEVMDIKTLQITTLFLKDCEFGYRESIFKGKYLNKYVITSVTFNLTDVTIGTNYTLKTSYGDIQEALTNLPGALTIKKVAQAVIQIRSSKLPDPAILGNSGSFFKNPIIEKPLYDRLVIKHPEMPHYPVNDNFVKVPAGWLIEKSGFKGKRYGDAGIHDKQALVLVNHGNATGNELLAVARIVQETVLKNYGIAIETEVNLIED